MILAHRLHRPIVQHQGAAHLQVAGQPLFAAAAFATAIRGQQGAEAFAGAQAVEDTLDTPTDDHRMPAGTRQRALPAVWSVSSRPQGAGTAAGHRIELRIIGHAPADQLGIGIVARIGVEHPVAIGG